MPTCTASGIVENGLSRWWTAAATATREVVIAEYSERFHKANGWKRDWLRLEVEREVSRRLKNVKPPSPESLF